MTNIYDKLHSVHLTSNKDKRKITLKVEIECANSGVNNKELFIRLIDSESLSFLFCLRINDDNFQELKSQQGLLVDLGAFGQRLIDLLDTCRAEEASQSPRYILGLCGSGTGDLRQSVLPGANWTLNFIETNPFKHLTHLSLRFCHGDADQFRDYLTGCLRNCRLENSHLSTKLEQTESELKRKLFDTETGLSECRQQLVSLQATSKAQLEELRVKLEEQTRSNREKLSETESYYQTRLEQERRDWDCSSATAARLTDAKIENLERTNRCLCDENGRLESEIKEYRQRVESLEESVRRANHEVSDLRRSVDQIDKNSRELESQLQKCVTRNAVLEQEVRDKEQQLSRSEEQRTTEHEARNRLFEENQKKSSKIEKLERALKNLNEEVSKGNEIILKLQSDVKHSHSKIKVRTQITTEQEKLLTERETELKKLSTELDSLRKELSVKEVELEKSVAAGEAVNKKLEEANHVIKTNENVINWLNRQVTEYELAKQKPVGYARPPLGLPFTGTSILTDPTSAATSTVAGTVKYRPMSVSTSGSGTASSMFSQTSLSSQMTNAKIDSLKTLSSVPEQLPVSNQPLTIDPKYLAKPSAPSQSHPSTDRAVWNKFSGSQHQPPRTNPLSNIACLPEEPDSLNSPHQQSLSSAYFPKPIIGGPR